MSDTKSVLKAHMAQIPVNKQNGIDFYTFLFTAAPDLRKYFKGAENMEPAAVKDSERFQKQGLRLLTSVHVSIELLENDPVFAAYVAEVGCMKHKQFKIPFDTMKAFFPAFVAYVEQKTGAKATPEQKAAWDQLDQRWMTAYKTQAPERGCPL